MGAWTDRRTLLKTNGATFTFRSSGDVPNVNRGSEGERILGGGTITIRSWPDTVVGREVKNNPSFWTERNVQWRTQLLPASETTGCVEVGRCSGVILMCFLWYLLTDAVKRTCNLRMQICEGIPKRSFPPNIHNLFTNEPLPFRYNTSQEMILYS